MDESVELARAFRGAGYTRVFCTPHLVKGSFDIDNATVGMIRAALQADPTRQRIDLRLLPGREYYLDEFLRIPARSPAARKFKVSPHPGSRLCAGGVRQGCLLPDQMQRLRAHDCASERCVLFALPKQKQESVLGKALRTIFTGAGKNNFKTRP